MPSSNDDRVSGFVHAAHDYTGEEMLTAFIAERLETMADRMVSRGCSRIGLFGSREHAIWLVERIVAMRTLPIVAFIDRPDRPDERTDIGVPVFQIGDAGLKSAVDTVLVADDRCETALRELAEAQLPPRMLIFTLYNRLGIGGEPLTVPGSRFASAEAEAKPGAVSMPDSGSAVRATAGERIAKLTAGTVSVV